MVSDKFNDYINTHPRQCLWILVIGSVFVWQSVVAISGLILYLLVRKDPRLQWWALSAIGVILALITACFSGANFFILVHDGFRANVIFWQCLFAGDLLNAVLSIKLNYLIGFPILVSGILSTIDLIPGIPYEDEMSAL